MKDMKNTLAQIHASLSHTREMDPALREKLVALDRDIQRLLEKDEHSPYAYSGLQETARDLAAQFTGKHPNLALLIRQLSNILGRIGI